MCQGAPDEDLLSVVYVSSAKRDMPEAELAELLHNSRQNNEKVGITGLLLYKDGNFMQAIEGPREAVLHLARKVETDARHRGMIILTQKPSKERNFADWSMAFQNLDQLPEEDAAAFSPFLSTSLLDEKFRSTPANCYRLLLRFKANIR